MYYIYRITNKINGKTYIGQHKYKKLDDDYMGSGVLLARAYKKHGIENFAKEILYSNIQYKETADDVERFAIAKERALGKAEYNIADGGSGVAGYKHSEETKHKLSEAHRGKKQSEESKRKISEALKGNDWNKGRKRPSLTEEHRRKLAEARRGKPGPMKGKHHSEETKKKISESLKGKPGTWLGRHPSEETKRKISEAKKGKHWKLVDGKRVYY